MSQALRVCLFGASGMIGQGVLRECILDKDVSSITTIGRGPSPVQNAKIIDIVMPNLLDFSSVEGKLKNLDACYYCLGVSSAGMSEADYERITFTITMAAASTLMRLNPQMSFIFISGSGADSSEKGRTMWARIKGKTENELFKLPFKTVCAFRPGIIQAMHGEQSRTTTYRIMYTAFKPLFPLLTAALPGAVTTTERIGRAMLRITRDGTPQKILENRDINRVARLSLES